MYKYSVFSRLFSTFLLILFYLSNSYRCRCEVTKCCSETYILQHEHGFYCEPTVGKTNWDAYNLPISLVSNCSEFRNVFEGRESYIELNGCLDKDKDEQYVAIACSKDSATGVHLVNKCCPIGQSYDHSGRFCVRNSEVHGHFKRLFENVAVVFENIVPNCSPDEVYVEYFSTAHTIHFDGRNLNVNGNAVESNKFCIEDLVNVGHDKSENHIIIRSCQSRSICEKIPCIRRCCKADQVMEAREGGYKTCLDHPNKTNLQPTFYNVSLPLDGSQKPASTFVKGKHDNDVIIHD